MTLGFSYVDHTVRELDLPNLLASVSDSEIDTLAVVADERSVSLSDLNEQTDHSKSTVTRHVNHLEEQGVVETSMHTPNSNYPSNCYPSVASSHTHGDERRRDHGESKLRRHRAGFGQG